MYMGGKQRTFSDAFRPTQTFIGIHGAHDQATKAVNPILQPQIFAFYRQNMSERFNTAVMNQALYDMDDSGALLRVFDAARLPRRAAFHCRSVQTLRRDCSEIKDADALSLGIVTGNTITALNLPATFKQVPMVLGREMTQAFPDLADYLKTMSEQACSSDPCRKLISDFSKNPYHKAIALPLAGEGLGTVSNQDTPINAFVRAIFNCNHARGRASRLCEARITDGYDVSNLYAMGQASHVEALAKLGVPADKFYGNEEFGGGMTTASGMRTQKVHDITPQKLDGINAAGDALYEARFSGLLKLHSPDPARPIVFYCLSRDCWLSANAAKRAQKLGYGQVGWYRGGMESWKAANLPVGQVVLRGVVR